MPYLRQRQRIPANGRVSVRLTTSQRDLFTGTRDTPTNLGFALRKAPVRNGDLSIRVNRHELDALIAVAAKTQPADKQAQRKLESLLKYLESLEDRFELE